MQSYDGNDITPPITPLKFRRKKEVSPIDVEAATAHFRDTWTRTPTRSGEDLSLLSLDALDTPPLSAASTSGEVSAPLDSVHPLFSKLSMIDAENEKGHATSGLLDCRGISPFISPDYDVFGIGPPQHQIPLNLPAQPVATPLLPSVPEFFARRDTDQYHYSVTTDSIAFFDSNPRPDVRERSQSPSTTPKADKKKRRRRRSGKARVIGGSPIRTTPTRSRPDARTSGPRSASASLTGDAAHAGVGGRLDNVFLDPVETSGDDVRPHQRRILSPASSRRVALAAAVVAQRAPFGSSAGNSRDIQVCGAATRRPLQDRSQNAPPGHMPSNDSKIFTCLCGRMFARQDAMERHMRITVCRRVGLGLEL